MTQEPDARREGDGVARADLRGPSGGGLQLPSLKLRRVRGGLTQKEELAERVGRAHPLRPEGRAGQAGLQQICGAEDGRCVGGGPAGASCRAR
jgi:hypothetical protein